IRSMSTQEVDHGPASFLMRTGYPSTGPVQYPTFGALVAKELGDVQATLPNFVSISPYRIISPDAYSSGFLGPQYAPLIIGQGHGLPRQQEGSYEQALKVQDIDLPAGVNRARADARLGLLEHLETNFIAGHTGMAPLSHRTAYAQAVRLMKTAAHK